MLEYYFLPGKGNNTPRRYRFGKKRNGTKILMPTSNRRATSGVPDLQCTLIHSDVCLQSDTLGSAPKFITYEVEANNTIL